MVLILGGVGAGKELRLMFKDDPEKKYRFYRVKPCK